MSKRKFQSENYFGGCPECGGSDGVRNVGRVHWCFCSTHGLKWAIGSNLFSSWHNETEDDWRRNAEMLALFTEVEKLMPYREKLRTRAARALLDLLRLAKSTNSSIRSVIVRFGSARFQS